MFIEIKECLPVIRRDDARAKKSAHGLNRHGVTPYPLFLASISCAVPSGCCFLWAFYFSSWLLQDSLLILAAVLIQCRLICNLLEGRVAVKRGRAISAGSVCSALPDRVSDTLMLVGAGCGLSVFPYAGTLGWVTALLALITAYRYLSGGISKVHKPFLRPMARLCGATSGAMFVNPLPSTTALFLPAGHQSRFAYYLLAAGKTDLRCVALSRYAAAGAAQ